MRGALRYFYLLRRPPCATGPSQAEPLGDAAPPGVLALPLSLLLQQRLEAVLRGAVFGARLLLREEIWEREGLSVGLRSGKEAAAGRRLRGGRAPSNVDRTSPPPTRLPPGTAGLRLSDPQ